MPKLACASVETAISAQENVKQAYPHCSGKAANGLTS